MSSSSPPLAAGNPLVVQHNALVNAGFTMAALEMRCFLAMLARISRDDKVLAMCRIPVRELCPDSGSKNVYQDVREMTEKLASRYLLLEGLGAGGERLPEPDLKLLPLLGAINYLRREGVVVAAFNERLRPYLLELRHNFTKAQLPQLLKIKRPASHRIYWLLREYAAFGKRTVSLAGLRHVLGFQQEYAGRFDHFKARVLDPAQQELAATDLPFTYELVREGKAVRAIRFLFAPGGLGPPEPLVLSELEAAVVGAGVAVASLPAIRAQLAAGTYEEGYVRYVLASVHEQVRLGRVKKEGGAVFRALTENYLLPAYRKTLRPAPSPRPAPPRATAATLATQRRKLQAELDDALNSRRFVETAGCYTEATRPAALAEVRARIEQVQAQLRQVAAGGGEESSPGSTK